MSQFYKVYIEGAQRKAAVAAVAPGVYDAGTEKGAFVQRAVLGIYRKLEFGARIYTAVIPVYFERRYKAREGERGGSPAFPRPFVALDAAYLVAAREADVSKFGAAEQVAVLAADGGPYPEKVGRYAAFEVDLVALPQSRGAVYPAQQVPFGSGGAVNAVVAYIGHLAYIKAVGDVLEQDVGTAEKSHAHQACIRLLYLRRIVKVVGIQGYGAAENLFADPGLPFI